MTTENLIDGLLIRARSTQLWRAIQWINRHGTSAALLLLLLGACALAQSLAATKIEIERGLGIGMDSLSLRRAAGIEFIHRHWWFALPYVTRFVGSLIWLEARSAPRWAVWVVFTALAVPCLR